MSKVRRILLSQDIGGGVQTHLRQFSKTIMNPKSAAMAQKRLALRKKLWPKLDEKALWYTRNKGFSAVPRGLSLVCRAMDEMSKGTSLSSTYVQLWCRIFEQAFVDTSNHAKQAFAAGFRGQRAVIAWKKRISILKKLGFIDTSTGDGGDPSHVLLFNPYRVVKRHFEKKTPGLSRDTYNALLTLVSEIGASDLD